MLVVHKYSLAVSKCHRLGFANKNTFIKYLLIIRCNAIHKILIVSTYIETLFILINLLSFISLWLITNALPFQLNAMGWILLTMLSFF